MNCLYWVDVYKDKLEYLDFSNNNRVMLLLFLYVGFYFFGLIIFGNYLYWIDWVNGVVIKCNKDMGVEVEV